MGYIRNKSILLLILTTTIICISTIINPIQGLSINNSIIQNKSNNLPSHFSWRNINGIDYTTPIKDQTPIPSCESFAFVAAVETMVQYKIGYPFGCDLSEAHLFFWSKGDISFGSYPEDNAEFLKKYGVPDEACWPYPTVKYQYPKNTTSPDWKNRTVKIKDWGILPEDIESIKNALIQYGPIISIFQNYEDFMHYKKGVYKHIWGKSLGPHIIAIVGYNDNPGYWICRNSWGTKWGDDGWFKIKYGECLIEKNCYYISDVYGNFPITYVDDDNKNGPWDGSIKHPYEKIQDAIDKTRQGYTLMVNNGIYKENLQINKSINIDGYDKNTTIIDGKNLNDIIVITAPNIRISGFTIQNSGNKLFDSGIKIRLGPYISNIKIKNNIIRNNQLGIYFYSSNSNLIEDNYIYENYDGIHSIFSFNNLIQNNKIIDNSDDGIHLDWSQSVISENIISDNTNCGINLRAGSDNNVIKNGNTIKNNNIGIKIEKSNINLIKENNFINNNLHAYFKDSFFNKWRKNYWNDKIPFIPKIIKGYIGKMKIPCFNIDWNPSRKPNFNL